MWSTRVGNSFSNNERRLLNFPFEKEKRWQFTIEKSEELWLRREYDRGHLWHKYSVTANQVMVAEPTSS